MNTQTLVLDINKKPFQVITANTGEIASRFIKIYLVDNSKALLDTAKQIHFSDKDFYTDKNIEFHYHICDTSNINKESPLEH